MTEPIIQFNAEKFLMRMILPDSIIEKEISDEHKMILEEYYHGETTEDAQLLCSSISSNLNITPNGLKNRFTDYIGSNFDPSLTGIRDIYRTISKTLYLLEKNKSFYNMAKMGFFKFHNDVVLPVYFEFPENETLNKVQLKQICFVDSTTNSYMSDDKYSCANEKAYDEMSYLSELYKKQEDKSSLDEQYIRFTKLLDFYFKMNYDYRASLKAAVKAFSNEKREDFANRIGIHPQTLYKCLNGERKSLNSIIRICLGLNLPPFISLKILDDAGFNMSLGKHDHRAFLFVLMFMYTYPIDKVVDFITEVFKDTSFKTL